MGVWRPAGPWGTVDRPTPNETISSIVYHADIVGNDIENIEYSPFTNLNYLDGSQHYAPSEIWWHRQDGDNRTICFGSRMGGTVKIAFPTYDNPFVEEITQRLLWLESSTVGNRDIFAAIRLVSGQNQWLGPINANATGLAINTAEDEIQACFRFGKLYFTRAYRQILAADFNAKTVTALVGVDPGATTILAIGEPTVDIAGNMYFVVVFAIEGGYDCDVYKLSP